MISNHTITGVSVAALSRTLHAAAHPAAIAAAAIAAPRKRRAAAATAASVNRGSL